MRYLPPLLLALSVLYTCTGDRAPTPAPPSSDLVDRWDKTAPVATHGLGHPWLSDYGFFNGPLADLAPAERVIPYKVNAPLFSDHAAKARFLYLPPGTRASYHPRETFGFPEGAVLIKHFYYDDPAAAVPTRRLIETRLLVRTPTGWQPLSYLWDAAQTDARFTLLGASVPVTGTDAAGRPHRLAYAVPDLNQCKNCHAWAGRTRPIGPSARQLNGTLAYADGLQNQLDYWTAHDLLAGAPAAGDRPTLAAYATATDPTAAARAYLDANCAHCHRPEGSAKTAGLNLLAENTNGYSLGIGKPPVAAGRASGDLAHSIVPGHPEASILLHRMNSTDPAVAMPEVGRALVDEQGVALVAEWIRRMSN